MTDINFGGGSAPVEPSADARAFAKAMHEMFVALMSEGFNEQQAMHIIGVGLAASIQGGNRG